jgi:septal ring factor EnvC (AmiA/AmiB activator)
MGEEDKEQEKTPLGHVWVRFKGFLSNISTKIKLIIGAIVGVFAVVMYFVIKKEMNEKEILELQLNKLETEIKVKLKQEDIDKNSEEILSLEEEKKKIIEKIKEIKNEDLSKEDDLDKFFDDRGF